MLLTVALTAASFPLKHGGYVAAAYTIFLALILIYLVIMTKSLRKVGREIEQLKPTGSKEQFSE